MSPKETKVKSWIPTTYMLLCGKLIALDPLHPGKGNNFIRIEKEKILFP